MTEHYPFVSILIPIRDESAYIERCMNAVLAQDYPAERMEILIADGMSTDTTRDLIAQVAAGNPQIPICILDNPGLIVATGLNIAMRQAKGEIIVRVDGHAVIATDYVRLCVDHLLRDGVTGVGGPMETVGESYMAQAIAIGMSSLFGVGDSIFRTMRSKTILADTVPFPAYTREIMEKAGLYDEELVRNQDDEYNYRLRKLGGKILFSTDVRSRYYSRSSLRSLWLQYYQYGFYKVRVLQKHPRQMRPRQFAPPAFVGTLLFSALLTLFYPPGWFLLVLAAGSYILANLTASSWTAGQRGWKYLPLLPVVYFILHFSYGLGFLAGLVKFINRWRDKSGKVPAF